MVWSRYNRLFHLKRFGWFLYNILSNTLIELDEAHYSVLADIAKQKNSSLTDEAFLSLLREKQVLVEPGEEENQLLVRQYQRHATLFDNSALTLTICPTLRCNFRCPYCFESSQRDGAVMSSETANSLMAWIQTYRNIHTLSVTWYGGEPLLSFDTICDLTQRFKALDLTYENIGLITNGYLLDREKIIRLNDLKITRIQITLDGPRDIHDTRRIRADGGPTFDRIMKNIETLMDSDYAGKCTIRVNIDKHNIEHYFELRAALMARFKGENFSVYTGLVKTDLPHSYDHGCVMNNSEWGDFVLSLYYKIGHQTRIPNHPGGNIDSICTANRQNAFVVGPQGELYKCWEDVGNPVKAIGNIHEKNPITNSVLVAQYCTGTDPYNTPECRACDMLPICGGGCANKRLNTGHPGEESHEYCSLFKTHLLQFLEVYVDMVHTRKICEALVRPGVVKTGETGYAIISPEPLESAFMMDDG